MNLKIKLPDIITNCYLLIDIHITFIIFSFITSTLDNY